MNNYLTEFERSMLRGPISHGPNPQPAPGPSNIPFEVQEEADRITFYVCIVWLCIIAYCLIQNRRHPLNNHYRHVLV